MGAHLMYASLILRLVTCAFAQTGILPCGILYHRDEPSLLRNGFIKCYDQPYSHITTSAELSACTGTNVVFVGAKSNTSTAIIALGAFGLTKNVYKITSSTSTAYFDPGGAYWYNYPNWGFGFSGVPTVNIFYCDAGQAANDCAYRLCWNLDEGIGGARVGCTENLDNDNNRRKVMYKGNQVYSCTSVCNDGAVRLQNGTSDSNGRVEVCYNDTWGTVCDNNWGTLDALVVCRQLGYGAGTTLSNAYYGQGNVSILLDNLNCFGNESSLLNCSNPGIGVTSCTHADDASVQCSNSLICRNTNGSFSCSCIKGYTLSPDNSTCSDINECLISNGGCAQNCTNINGSFLCSCRNGYNLNADNRTCSPICSVLYSYDEATLNLSRYTKCYDQPYSHVTTSTELAACKGTNWVFVGAKRSSNSGSIVLGAFGYSSAVFTQTSSTTTAYLDRYGGAYWYNYPSYGFGFSGVSTVTIYDCDYGQAAGDCAYRLCWNLDFSIGGYRVGCTENLNSNTTVRKVMYKGNQVHTCTPDVNECDSYNGNCSQICINTLGSFSCACKTGFTLDNDTRSCSDVDECALNNGNCQQICTNIPGSYICSCMDGYALTSDNITCSDINECMVQNGNCSQICNNYVGNYLCLCTTGFALSADGKNCIDYNECAINNGNCQQICSNTPGSYRCSCMNGYVLAPDANSCYDINECLSSNGNCSQICINSVGSYMCSCASDHYLNMDNVSCSGPTTLIQLRLTEVHNCTDWKLDGKNARLIAQSVETDVNAFCSCGFKIYNQQIYCFDGVSITLRGNTESKLLNYMQSWLSSINSSLSFQGTNLFVDKKCMLAIQSLSDPACQIMDINAASTQTTLIGITSGTLVVFCLALILTLIFVLWAYGKLKRRSFTNPIYSKGNVAQVQYDIAANQTYKAVNEIPLHPINTSSDAQHLYDYAAVVGSNTGDCNNMDGNQIHQTDGTNYETIDSSDKTGDYAECSDACTTGKNSLIDNYAHIGDPFVLHYDIPGNLAVKLDAIVVENTSASEEDNKK